MDSAANSRWYVAVLVVAARVTGTCENERPIDQQLRLIQAPDADAAFARAHELGAAAEHSYLNSDGARVHWEFCGLADLAELDAEERNDGGEIYSWHTRGDPVAAVMPKERLSVFWVASNRHRGADELLD